MLDANLYTLNFVRSTNEPEKLFLIQESTGEPVYFRLRQAEGSETRTELYHASTIAPLGVFQHISSKLKLISLANPSATIELKNSGYINFEWTFYFDKILKFCWRKDIIGLAGSKRGYTCWMSRKPDPDYPCAIYKPGTSSVPPSCQFLDFNIRRIENLQDPRGLEFAIILALLGFTETVSLDQESRRSPSPPHSQKQLTSAPGSSSMTNYYDSPPIEANELRVHENSSTSELVAQGHKLFEDPLFLYLLVHAPNPKSFKRATVIAEQIKRDRSKRHGEELYQYLVDDIISEEIASGRRSSLPPMNTGPKPNTSLKVYLSRTPLDELLPKSATKKLGKSSFKPQLPPKESSSPSTIQSRFMTGVHRPFSKIASIASFSSRSSAYYQYQHNITPYYLEEEDEEEQEPEQENEEQERQEEKEAETQEEEKEAVDQEKDSQDCHDEGGKELGSTEEKQEPIESEKAEAQPFSPTQEPAESKGHERFMICANELRPMSEEKQPKNKIVMVKESVDRKRESRIRWISSSRTSPPIDPNDDENGNRSSRESSTSFNKRYSFPVERADSVRSKSSTIRSTASSFVEIVLSSCCQAYSSAFSSSPSPVDGDGDRSTTPHHHHHHKPLSAIKRLALPRRNHISTPPSSSNNTGNQFGQAWKRLSSASNNTSAFLHSYKPSSNSTSTHTSNTTTSGSAGSSSNPSDFVSNLFSRKIHLS
ncbi:hypothetical protein PSHT_15709 [Puccinia striiformis]|uniref:Uncharacterized protein n=1 Tax=Puccinia striiformis TaxID=27350 RepID=A0A2S4UDF4_9BASI|nr:hypothetical protein PSHT_15709 [Puccinia striiformis]